MLLVGLGMRAFDGLAFRSRRSRDRAPRLAIPDTLTVDSRRKLVLIRRDNIEHLVLIGGNTDFVIEPAIQRFTPNTRGRAATGTTQDAPVPQPAALPPRPAAAEPSRPLAARSQRAVEAGQHPRGESRPAPAISTLAVGPTGRSPPNADRSQTVTASKESVPASEKPETTAPRPAPAISARSAQAPPKSGAVATSRPPPPTAQERPTLDGKPTAASAAKPADSAAKVSPSSVRSQQEPPVGQDLPPATQPSNSSYDSRRSPSGAASETRQRPAARPTAAAKPPSGHPSNMAATTPELPNTAVVGEGPTEPLPRPPTVNRAEARPGKLSSRTQVDTDMTALLGKIFGQNKH